MPEIISEHMTYKIPDISGILMKDRVPADHPSEVRRKKSEKSGLSARTDRPGWIPPEITRKWDTNPYAYQTEEELMPAGRLHGKLLTGITEILGDFFERNGLQFLADTFILYRDPKGIKQRISPDLMIIPSDPDDSPPSAYDLDKEPPPLAVAEITSPKSRKKDMEKKASLYSDMGVPVYLVIDQISAGGKPHKKIGLHLWRKIGNRMISIQPDDQGYLAVPEMKIRIQSEDRNLIFSDIRTGEILLNNRQHRLKADKEKQRAEQEKQRADRLEAKLKSLGISPD